MRVLVSRVSSASVKVDGKKVGECGRGLLILSCFTEGDTSKEIDYMVRKCTNLRIFDDENGVMNKSVQDIGGSILSISQFTLYADATKGNRPSYLKALSGDKSKGLYEEFSDKLNGVVKTERGIFGADMKIDVNMDGPVNIIIDK